jgi:hypothetical protein
MRAALPARQRRSGHHRADNLRDDIRWNFPGRESPSGPQTAQQANTNIGKERSGTIFARIGVNKINTNGSVWPATHVAIDQVSVLKRHGSIPPASGSRPESLGRSAEQLGMIRHAHPEPPDTFLARYRARLR